MNLLTRTTEILEDAERDLRALLEDGVSKQRYGEIAAIARIAEQLANLRAELGLEESTQLSRPKAGPAMTAQLRKAAGAQVAKQHVVAGEVPVPKGRSMQREVRPAHRSVEYPLFERDGDKLVKIGWSERDGRIYEHRAPRAVVRQIYQAIARAGRNGKQFKMDPIIQELSDGSVSIPSYQAYLALAWLRSRGLIERDGKEGYRISAGALTPERLDQIWSDLNQRA